MKNNMEKLRERKEELQKNWNEVLIINDNAFKAKYF